MPSGFRRAIGSTMLIAVVTALGATGAALGAVPSTDGLQETPTVNVKPVDAITVVAPDDVWAISGWNPAVWRWNGQHWRSVDQGTPCREAMHFADVDAAAADAVWIVGDCDSDAPLRIRTLVTFWDGTDFTRLRSPNQGHNDRLLAVSALAANDVWVAGVNAGGGKGIVMQYDGQAWRVLDGAGIGAIRDIRAFSDDDVWVTGGYQAAHWDGARWQRWSLPGASSLASIDGATGDDVWVVGLTRTHAPAGAKIAAGRYTPYAAHWDGATWTPSSMPKVPGLATALRGVSVLSSGEAWAVGGYKKGSAGEFVEHWDGDEWTVAQVYKGDDIYSYGLNAVAAVGPDDVWVGGDVKDAYSVVHGTGSVWTKYALP